MKPDEGRAFRKLNLQIGVAGAIVAAGWYLWRGRQATQSDNVGLLLLPWVSACIHLPLASAFAGIVELLLFRKRPTSVPAARWFAGSQAVIVKFLGVVGIGLAVVAFADQGSSGVMRLVGR